MMKTSRKKKTGIIQKKGISCGGTWMIPDGRPRVGSGTVYSLLAWCLLARARARASPRPRPRPRVRACLPVLAYP